MPTNSHVIEDALASIREPDAACREAARELQSRLTKPAGALGRLEELHIWAAGVLRDPTPAPPRKTIIVAAADHGVASEGVSAYPQDVTAQMVRNFLAGGAAINALAAQAGARLRIVDAGVALDIADERLVVAKVRRGTGNMTRGSAMTREDAEAMLARGIAAARDEYVAGATVIGLGDMGIGNTTAAAAITSVLTHMPPPITAGRGTGIDDKRFAAKVDAIARAIEVNHPDALDPIDVLAKVGGLEIAFLAGCAIGAASSASILIVDGYPTTAAALIAAALAPAARDYLLASHLSAEPGHRIALEHLRLQPLLDLGMRLGEGTGAAIAMPVLDAALRLPREMATFEVANVSRSNIEVPPET
jgi:nicotinate-nucleotide--dimethylbenzimidazole phosphoribosyltransferase